MKRSFLETLFEAPPTSRASPKDYDPKMQHERLSWAVHSASCQHVGNFNTYYHMSLEQFEGIVRHCGISAWKVCHQSEQCNSHGPGGGAREICVHSSNFIRRKNQKFGTDFSCLNCKRQACVQRRSGCYCELWSLAIRWHCNSAWMRNKICQIQAAQQLPWNFCTLCFLCGRVSCAQ